MKLIQGILGCALVAGLVALAADKAQAGVVIGNSLYAPLSIKLSVRYYDKNDKIKQYRVTSKDVIKTLGLPKGDQLAVEHTGSDSSSGDVWVINKTTLVSDVTASGYLSLTTSDTLDNDVEKASGSYKYAEAGILELDVYDTPIFGGMVMTGGVVNASVAEGLDQAASREASGQWFEITGFYSYKEKGSAIDKKGNETISSSLKAGALSGTGADAASKKDVPTPTALTGSASAKGKGKVNAGT
jgi:hypothetical protein